MGMNHCLPIPVTGVSLSVAQATTLVSQRTSPSSWLWLHGMIRYRKISQELAGC